MSSAEYPRKFKFVGGPSRKRRRCAPSCPDRATLSTRLPPATRLEVGSDDERVSAQHNSSTEKTHLGEYPRIDGHTAPDPAFSDYGTPTSGTAAFTPIANKISIRSDSSLPYFVDDIQSLSDWTASSGLAMNSDALGTALLPTDHLFPVDSPPHGSPGSIDHDAHPEQTVDPTRDLAKGNYTTRPLTSSRQQSSYLQLAGYLGRDDRRAIGNSKTARRSSSDDLDELLSRYDHEFCVWPLTQDFAANPFRYDIESGKNSSLLWHSVLALSYRHIHHDTGSFLTEAKAHKRKALQLLEDSEATLEPGKSTSNLLNALLILMTLDCAISAQGPWVEHLSRAQHIVEALLTTRCQITPRLQAQMDMLVWWDVTLSLTARRGFVLSGSATSVVLNSNSASTFYNVTGCPNMLFKYMVRLGAYAHESELASQMTCVHLDMGPILAVEKAIKEWKTPPYHDSDVDCQSREAGISDDLAMDPIQKANYNLDLYHCAEAWRFALLVYIERVFKWRHGKSPIPHVPILARKALNNVRSCRRSFMIQKQLLLPVFLAACETKDEDLRDEARSYCRWWRDKTRYDMFMTTIGLLEEVWAADGDHDSWWGSVIDRRSAIDDTTQYLFG